MNRFIPILLLLIVFSCDQSEKTTKPNPADLVADPDNAGIIVPEGFAVLKVAEELGKVRHLAVRKNGDIYLNLRNPKEGAGGLVALRDTTNDGRADIISYFTEVGGTGLGLYNGYLYYSSDSSVLRRKFNGDELVPSGPEELVVSGFEYRPQHAAKSFTFDKAGNIYVNVGAPSNACQEQDRTKGSPGQDPCPLLEKFGGIWRFDANKLNQDQMADGLRFATGMRNAVGVRWNGMTDNLYAIPHGRDNLHDWYPDTYTMDDPGEELFLLTEGSDGGWPYCYYDFEAQQKLLNPEYGGDGQAKIGRCENVTAPVYAFPGHWAPNDLIFYDGNMFPDQYSGGVFVASHGSWNRPPDQQGYNVAFIPFDGDSPKGDHQIFADGFKGVEELSSPRDAIYRPTGLAIGPDGSLFISDDQNGTVFRVVYNGK